MPTAVPPWHGVEIWRPQLNMSWQWQLSDLPVDQSFHVQMYDVDLFDNDATVVQALHRQGQKVICYMNAGGWENLRPPWRMRYRAEAGW